MAWFGLHLGQLMQGQEILVGIVSTAVLAGLIYLWRREMLRREASFADADSAGSAVAASGLAEPAGA